MSHNLNRRTVLAGAAVAVPAAAIGAAPALASPDAELIALGNELEALLRRYVPTLLNGLSAGWDAWDRSCERAGIVDDGGHVTEQEAARHSAEWTLAYKEAGLDENERFLKPLYRDADRLMNAINALPATTEEGLRAKVLNVCLTNVSTLWMADSDGGTLSEREVREMVIATCSVLEITLPDGFPVGGSETDPPAA